MDRRDALRKMAAGGAIAATAPAILTSTAFADGGTRPLCRPTPSLSNTLTASITGSGKNWISITPSTATFSAISCPTCGGASATASVQARWELTSAPAGSFALYNASTGGAQVGTAFTTASGTSTAVTSPVYVRATGGGNLSSGTYVARLTVRYICTVGTKKYWSCRAYAVSVVFSSAGGSDGTMTSQTPSTIGPPDNSSSCDTPAP